MNGHRDQACMGWGALGQAPRAASRDVGLLSGERTVTKHSRQEEAVQGKESKAPEAECALWSVSSI